MLKHSGSNLIFHLTVPKHLRHRLPRSLCGRAKPGAPLSLQSPKLCPPPAGILLHITGCCLQFPMFPINTTLVALEPSLWEHLCVLFPSLSQILGFSLPEGFFKSPVSFCQWGGWAPATSSSGCPHPAWVYLGTFPLKYLIGGSRHSLFC